MVFIKKEGKMHTYRLQFWSGSPSAHPKKVKIKKKIK